MGVRLLLLYLIYQAVTTATLGGVIPPYSDSIGKATPIKPKPLTTPTVSSSVTNPSLICDEKDIIPRLIPATAKESVKRDFFSPLAFTSSSRALPVPKIDSLSMEDVKIPERLRDKFLSIYNASIRNAKSDKQPTEVSMQYKYPFSSSPTNLPNATSTNYLSDMCTIPLNTLSPLPSINSLPYVRVKSLIVNSFISPSFNTNQFVTQPTNKLLSSEVIDSSKSLGTITPSFSEQSTSNTFQLDAPCSWPYPLIYKSMYLPGVKTPYVSLNNRPFSFKEAGNFNFPSQSSSCNLLTTTFDTSCNSLPSRNYPCLTPSSYTIKTGEILKPINPIELSKLPSSIPISTNTMSLVQDAGSNSLWPSKEVYTGSASIAFESKFEPSKSASPSIRVRSDQDPFVSLPQICPGRTSDIKLKPYSSPLMNPPRCIPETGLYLPKPPLVPISSSFPIVQLFSNRRSYSDSSNYLDTPDVFPIINVCTDTIERLNPNNYLTSFDSTNVPILNRINCHGTSYYHKPLFTKECTCIPFNYSPPTIPSEPIPTIFSQTSFFSPNTHCPSIISQIPATPVSYINEAPSSSITQGTSNMVQSITNLLSNIIQNILLQYLKSWVTSAPKNTQQSQNYVKSDHYVVKPEETLSVSSGLPFPDVSPVNTISKLPNINSRIDYLNAPYSPTMKSLDVPCQSSTIEVPSSYPVFITSQQLVLPPTSSITFPLPEISPSFLPSPCLPSYPTMSPSFYTEAPVFKLSSSKKDSDAEKLIELMLLAEILNNDESFDWDDLDTLLAYLSMS